MQRYCLVATFSLLAGCSSGGDLRPEIYQGMQGWRQQQELKDPATRQQAPSQTESYEQYRKQREQVLKKQPTS